jgi:hypothetical protein
MWLYLLAALFAIAGSVAAGGLFAIVTIPIVVVIFAGAVGSRVLTDASERPRAGAGASPSPPPEPATSAPSTPDDVVNARRVAQ